MSDSRQGAGTAPKAARAEAPLRRCLASGRSCPQSELLRFVISPDGRVVFDLDGRLPGRGLWVGCRRGLVAAAAARNLFAKAARAKVTVSEELADEVEAQLRMRVALLLGLTRKAGAATLGFEKVKAKLERGAVAVLVEASDAAEGGRGKLLQAARRHEAKPRLVDCLPSALLAQALGREHAVHVALAPGGTAERFLAAAERLAAYMEEAPVAGVRPGRGHRKGGPATANAETK